MQVQQLDTADETKVPMPRGGFAFAEVERSGDGDGEIRRTTSRLRQAHPGREQKMEQRVSESCSSAAAGRGSSSRGGEGLGLATIGKSGSAV